MTPELEASVKRLKGETWAYNGIFGDIDKVLSALESAVKALDTAKDALTARIDDKPALFYIETQFPRTVGHIQLREWFWRQNLAISVIDTAMKGEGYENRN